MTLDDEVDALYAADPDRFTETRNELVVRLRSDGRREDARTVAKLRKPTTVAWAINAVARADRERVRRLIRLGERARAAQLEAISAGDARKARAALDEERDLVAELADRAVKAAEAAGKSAGADLVRRAAATFHAAAMDEEAAEALLEARLTKDLRLSADPQDDWELMVGALKDRDPQAPRGRERERRNKLREEAARREEEAARLRSRADEAEAAARDAARDAERARKRAEKAEERAERARAEAGAAASSG